MFKVKAIKLNNHQMNLSIQNEESVKASTIQHLHDAICNDSVCYFNTHNY